METCPTCGSTVSFIPPPVLPTELGAAVLNRLNQREREILGMIVMGLQNGHIANRLGTTETVIKTALTHIMRKCEQTTRVRLAVFAVRQRMVIL
jgi:DNA-binding NarL/FixJ family response regulator